MTEFTGLREFTSLKGFTGLRACKPPTRAHDTPHGSPLSGGYKGPCWGVTRALVGGLQGP